MPMNFKDTLKFLIDFFEKEHIDYALIGAFALKAYGYTRATQDIDIVARRKDQNKIVAKLEAIGFETIYRSSGYSNHVHPISKAGRLDFVYVAGKTADTLFKAVRELLLLGDIRVAVVSPEHLVALKLFAIKNNPQRLLRDLADIKYLLDLPGVSKPEIKKAFEKYGLMDKYHELIKKEE